MADLLEFTSDPDETPMAIAAMICAVSGGPFDAGQVTGSINQTIGEGDMIATFDSDLIYDFRSERPMIAYENGQMAKLIDPTLDVYIVEDVEGTKFLLIRGSEPDLRWHSLADGVLQLATQFNVEKFYAVGGIPTGLPHTRPVDLLVRNFDKPDPNHEANYIQTVNFSEYLVYILGANGIDATSVMARVPFYLAGQVYAQAAGAIVSFMSEDASMALPLGDLERVAATETDQIDQAYAGQEEFAALLANLEEEYDTGGPNSGFVVPTDTRDIPSAEEIGAAAEQFLATRDGGVPRKRGKHTKREE